MLGGARYHNEIKKYLFDFTKFNPHLIAMVDDYAKIHSFTSPSFILDARQLEQLTCVHPTRDKQWTLCKRWIYSDKDVKDSPITGTWLGEIGKRNPRLIIVRLLKGVIFGGYSSTGWVEHFSNMKPYNELDILVKDQLLTSSCNYVFLVDKSHKGLKKTSDPTVHKYSNHDKFPARVTTSLSSRRFDNDESKQIEIDNFGFETGWWIRKSSNLFYASSIDEEQEKRNNMFYSAKHQFFDEGGHFFPVEWGNDDMEQLVECIEIWKEE